MDPQLYDSYLGLGIYQYYVDAMPVIAKLFSSWLLMPGSRTEGMRKLELAAEKGKYGMPMAKGFMAEKYGFNEGEHLKAIEIYKELIMKYPDNFRSLSYDPAAKESSYFL